jgi:hypothetical protein
MPWTVTEEIIPWTVESLPSPEDSPGATCAAAGGEMPSRFTAGGVMPSRFTAGGVMPSRFTAGGVIMARLTAGGAIDSRFVGGIMDSRFAGGATDSRFPGGAIRSRLIAGGERPSRLERFWRGRLVPNRIRVKTENKAEQYMASIS